MRLPLQNFRKNVHKSLIHMEAASPKMRNRHFGFELGKPASGRIASSIGTTASIVTARSDSSPLINATAVVARPFSSSGAKSMAMLNRSTQRAGVKASDAGENQSRSISTNERSEERRVGKECRSRWSPYH